MPKLDDITIGNYQIIARNLATAFIPYYENVVDLYSDISKGPGKVVREQQIRIADAMGLLGRVTGRGVTPVTKKELEKLNGLLGEIKKVHKQVSQWIKESAPYLKESEKAIKGLSISIEDIKTASDTVKEKEKLIRKGAGFAVEHPLITAIYGGIAWKGFGVARGVLDALGSILGPLQPLMAPTLGLVAGLGFGASRLLRKRRRKTPLEPPSPTGVASPSGVGGLAPISPVGMEVPKPGAFRSLGRRKKEELTEPLFYFFNKRAYKAGWTRDVLKALTGKRVTREGGGFGGDLLGGALGGTVASLGLLGAKIAGLGVVAGGAVWAVYGLASAIKDMVEAKKGAPPKKPSWWQKLTAPGLLTWLGTEYYKNPEAMKRIITEGGIEGPPTIEELIEKGHIVPITPEGMPLSMDGVVGKTIPESVAGEFVPMILKKILEAIQNQAPDQPAPAPVPRDSIGQRSRDEDPLIDKAARGELRLYPY